MMALLLAMFRWAFSARTIRSQVLSLKEREFMNLAKLNNMNTPEIIFTELIPQMLPYIGANFAVAVASCILGEVGLGLVGLGILGITTLGKILYWAQYQGAFLLGLWWWLFPPIIGIVLIVLSFHLVNMGLDEVFNPRLQKR
jgi:peptide/nickel transport system permease protein